jgi:hypothetical protein
VYRLSDVHKRFLAAPGLRLIPDASVVKQTILKAVQQGKAVLRKADGTAYDKDGAVRGPEGERRRAADEVPTVALHEDEFIARADSAATTDWLKVDATGHIGQPPPPPPPPEAATVIATNWPDILKHAETRPILEFTLDADTPTAAETLAAIAQPLGADALELTVTLSGELKSGGTASLEIQRVKQSSPIKPIETARMLFNAMVEGSPYGAQLHLTFKEPGRFDQGTQLRTASEKAGDNVRPSATFGRPAHKEGKS